MNIGNLKFTDTQILLIAVIVGMVFFIFVVPMVDNFNNSDSRNLKEQFNNLGDESLVKLDTKVCSKQCCKFVQWPVPFNTVDPNSSNADLKDYIGSNFTCNLGNTGGGCVCIKKSDTDYLANHGQNINP